jgi:hypothetical protein
MKYQLIIASLSLTLVAPSQAQISTGGGYTLTQAVIANGGSTSTDPVNNAYKIEGTAGQAAAGGDMGGGPTPFYNVKSGFWIGAAAPPTAAGVVVSGRVTTPNGNGIRNVRVTISGGNLTSPRVVLSSAFGYFSFDDIEAGHTYVVTVVSKRYVFAQPTQLVSVLEDVLGLSFTASWEN